MAELLVSARGEPIRIEATSDPDDATRAVYENGGLLPGSSATLAGPTFEEWLRSTST